MKPCKPIEKIRRRIEIAPVEETLFVVTVLLAIAFVAAMLSLLIPVI